MKSHSFAGNKDGNVTHHFVTARLRQTIGPLALLALLAGCGGSAAPTINPDNVVAVTRLDGAATLARPSTGAQGALPDQAQLLAGDHLYTASETVTLQFADGSTLQLAPESHLLLYVLRQSDRLPLFRLLAGAVTADLRGNTFEVQAYEEAAMNFNMVVTDLTAAPRGDAGRYRLALEGDVLKGTVTSGEFDLRSGNQQATLPAGWQAIAAPGRPLQVISLITPSPAPPSATEAPTATLIPIIEITPTRTATLTRTATPTDTPTNTRTPARPRRTATATPAPTLIADTPTATTRPHDPPPPPQPTNPPPPTAVPTDPPLPTAVPTDPPPQPTATERPPAP
jgi:hypothetical protein